MQHFPQPQFRASRIAGFTLVEVSLALAVVGIALIALFSLLPAGLGNFRDAMDAQTMGEIFQRVVADAQETDFDTLLASRKQTGGAAGQFYRLPLRHFDNQGTEVKTANPDAPTSAEAQGIIYTARVRGALPGDPDPRNHSASYATSLPGSGNARFNPRDLTFLTVEIAVTNGTHLLAPLVDSETFLLSPARAAKAGVAVRTYAAIVARNGYR